ncbi:hypothetical protein LuPra_06045 [Luteitalea pratensis]|uniref:Uncharacterized protein n=1 Tax=Luteitalea pratensis TaxID=1855912 RepID=A0A143PX65_LUTPR|nr:hypothetical protein LuPra_06045 [Luteitalea pratensis]
MGAQYLVYACALHADATAVHEAHLAQPGGVGCLEIGIDHIGDVAWRERVEIELRPDRHDVWIFHGTDKQSAGRPEGRPLQSPAEPSSAARGSRLIGETGH